MGLLSKVWGYISRIWGAVLNRYEAAYQQWGQRGVIWSSLQDARFDIDFSARQELQRRHRHWVANSTLVQRIRNLFIQFSVGVSGLQVVPNSEIDEDWNHSRQLSWQRWCRAPEINTFSPMSQVCIQWAGALFDDGEVFIHKTQTNRGVPAIETFEAHRIVTPNDKLGQSDIIDGIRYELTAQGGVGRPISYFVCTKQNIETPLYGSIPGSESFREIPASQMIHIFKVRRPGQLRGIPEGFSGMNVLNDYEELHKLEMQVAKMSSELGIVETNATGELDALATRRARIAITGQNGTGAVVTRNADQLYHVTIGARKIALHQGDKVSNFQVERPNITTQQYWDLLISQICCSYNVPKLLVVPYSLQGTVTRADLDVCANAFRANFELVAWGLQQVYEWQTEWAVRYDRSMDGASPRDYIACIIRPPRAPNVDIGYTAQALQIELQLGTKTLQDVYAERQQDWRHQLRQIAETEAYINDLATEFDIDPNRISQKAKEAVAKTEEEPKEENASV